MPLSFNFGKGWDPEELKHKPKTPVTLISGFLGAGKTTLLKHLLENQDGVRIAVIVNDVAAVNIDSQLVKRFDRDHVEIAELQNGCICCSSADDLFSAVQNVVLRSQAKSFEHIIIELSGVGEPAAIKKNWTIGLECGMPASLRTEVVRVVTVVDASTFSRDWMDTQLAQKRNDETQEGRHDDKSKVRFESVGQLLAEQVEWADVLVLNKMDLAQESDLQYTKEVVRALNRSALLVETGYGKVSPEILLPAVPKGLKMPECGGGAAYTWRQNLSEITIRIPIDPCVKGRDVDFNVTARYVKIAVKGTCAPKVEGKIAGAIKHVDDVVFEIEGSSSSRVVTVTLEKKHPGLWPGLWESDSMSVDDAQQPRMDFQLEHGHQHQDTSGYCGPMTVVETATANRARTRFGIHSFVYQRRRPFQASRLKELLQAWPALKQELFDAESLPVPALPPGLERTFKPVLRSKGFCWLDVEPLKEHVWAHAGLTFSVKPSDYWWAVLDDEQLQFKLAYPGVDGEYKALKRSNRWDHKLGDRRQELVFIGGVEMKESAIVPLLDYCLLTDSEFADFQTSTLTRRPPRDELCATDFLRNLGARENELELLRKEDTGNHAEQVQGSHSVTTSAIDDDRLRRQQDREDTDFLRALGVGAALEADENENLVFEVVD